MDEFELIRRFFREPHKKRLAQYSQVALGIGDDCAILNPIDQQIVISTDTMVAGRHFLQRGPGSWVADRALGAAVSDLAAMGASPLGFTLSLALSQIDEEWCESFARALSLAAEEWRIPLLGGDTVKGPLAVSLTVLGQVPPGTALCRSGAQVGDDVWVSGWLGGASAGLELAQLTQCPAPLNALLLDYLQPQPRVELGMRLRDLSSAAIDVSDGLLADLHHLLAASSVGAEIIESSLPVRPELLSFKGVEAAYQCALGGGDDYELCFTAPVAVREIIHALGVASMPVTRIGSILASPELVLLKSTGEPVIQSAKGFNHFSQEIHRK